MSNNLRRRLHYLAAVSPKTANFDAPKEEPMAPLKYMFVVVVQATVRSIVSTAIVAGAAHLSVSSSHVSSGWVTTTTRARDQQKE